MYYLLETNYFIKPTAYRTSSLVTEFRFKPSRWITGNLLVEPKHAIEVELWQNGGDGFAEMFLDSIPLFSQKLIKVLEASGVDNLQTFPVDIVEREGKVIDEAYLAVNIIGSFNCTEMGLSQHTEITGKGLIVDHDNEPKMFRSAESLSAIIVHESVKQALEKAGFKYLQFRALVNDVEYESR